MSDGVVFSAGWKLDDVQWSKFDATKIDPGLLEAVKAASLVEYNAPDYVIYLKRVFKDSGAQTLADIDRWGVEETQHGLALGRWCEMADPSFDSKPPSPASAPAIKPRTLSEMIRPRSAAAAAARWWRAASWSRERHPSTAPFAMLPKNRC